MRLKFWGTRGSIPTPGKETIRYGGNTPCVEVRLDDDSLVIFDAGTGIRSLGDALVARGESVKAYLAISHPHWDHIQGFPFFKPAFIPGNELIVIGPRSRTVPLRKMIADQMDRVYFPIRLNQLKAKITFRSMKEETLPVFGATLTSCYVYHPSFALGYRLEAGGRSLVYISDNEPFDRERARSLKTIDRAIVERFSKGKGNPNQRIFDFAQGAEVLIHDATYTPEEYAHHVGWGHSPYLFALEVAAQAEVQRLLLFHHNQTHSDAQIDEIVKKCRQEIHRQGYHFECIAAAEGMELDW